MQQLNKIPFKLESVYDPDTFKATFEGAGKFSIFTENVGCRIIGIDTPERGWRAKSEAEKKLEEIGRKRMILLFESSKIIRATIHTKKDRNGRFLVDLFFDDVNWSDIVIEEKLGVAYDGKKARSTDWVAFILEYHPHLITK